MSGDGVSRPDTGLLVTCRDTFLLRRERTSTRVGVEYPVDTQVELVELVPEVRRGPDESFWYVRVVADYATGYTFVAHRAIDRARGEERRHEVPRYAYLSKPHACPIVGCGKRIRGAFFTCFDCALKLTNAESKATETLDFSSPEFEAVADTVIARLQ